MRSPSADEETPVRRQRLASYAVLLVGRQILLTRLSEHTPRPGAWTLPGGGLDHGEDPRDGVVREVREETGLDVEVGRLLDVHSVHFTGRAPSGRLEDFHGVQLMFLVDLLSTDREPEVTEVGGTTDAVAWLPVEAVESGEVDVVAVVRRALEAHAADGVRR